MKIGDVIVVIGKTNHGRARIRAHGVHYKILGAIRKPDRINVESVDTGYKRWLLLSDDKHFGILKVDNGNK
jgi:hypothetical protein